MVGGGITLVFSSFVVNEEQCIFSGIVGQSF